MNKCLKCGGELLTGDVNGVCSKCRGETFGGTSTPLADIQNYVFDFEPYWKMLNKELTKMKRRKIYERKAKRSNIK